MSVSGRWVDDLLRRVATTVRVHDEPMPGAWFCGRCPYMNSGVICTKCGAPRWEGTASSPDLDFAAPAPVASVNDPRATAPRREGRQLQDDAGLAGEGERA